MSDTSYDIREMQHRALDIARQNREVGHEKGQGNWTAREYTEGLVGDVGDLMKLVMAKDGLRDAEDLDAKLKHELSDCLWSILVIADCLKIDLANAFGATMLELLKRLEVQS